MLLTRFDRDFITEALQVRDTTMCYYSPWSVVYAAICAFKAKTLKEKNNQCLSV